MKILNPEQADELFRRYFVTLKYFKQALVSVGKSASYKSFPDKNFFFNLRYFAPKLPRSIINAGIISFRNRVNFLAKKNNIPILEAIKMTNIRNLVKNMLICHWDLIFYENGFSVKCPDDVIPLRVSEPLSNVFTLKISRVGFSDYEATVIKQLNRIEVNA